MIIDPCAHCGTVVEVTSKLYGIESTLDERGRRQRTYEYRHYIICPECGATIDGRFIGDKGLEELIQRWNRRIK